MHLSGIICPRAQSGTKRPYTGRLDAPAGLNVGWPLTDYLVLTKLRGMSEVAVKYGARRSPRLSADERRDAIVPPPSTSSPPAAWPGLDRRGRPAGRGLATLRVPAPRHEKDLLLAVRLHGFRRTRLTFDAAALSAPPRKGALIEATTLRSVPSVAAFKRSPPPIDASSSSSSRPTPRARSVRRIVVRPHSLPSTALCSDLAVPPTTSITSSPKGCCSTSGRPSSSRVRR